MSMDNEGVRSPGSQGSLMYLALDFGEESTLLESPGSGQTKKWSLLFSQLLQGPTNHYLEVIHFFTSAADEICIRSVAMLSFIESLRSWIKGLSLFNSALQLLKEPAKSSPLGLHNSKGNKEKQKCIYLFFVRNQPLLLDCLHMHLESWGLLVLVEAALGICE